VSDSGYTISLTAVDTTSTATVLTFNINQDPHTTGPGLDHYGGSVPTDFSLTRLAWNGEHLGEVRTNFDRNRLTGDPVLLSVDEELEFAPISDLRPQVTITWNRLRFDPLTPDDQTQLVAGTWSFTFAPLISGQSAASTQLATPGLAQAQDITFAVDAVTLDLTQTVVDYRVESSRPGAMEVTGIVARLKDGTLLLPDRTDKTERGWRAFFPPFPPAQRVALILQPLLQQVVQPLDVRVGVDGRALATAKVGQRVSMHAAVVAVGEQLSLDEFSKDAGKFTLRFTNKQAQHAGTVLLRFPDGSEEVTLTDDQGNTYTMTAASTNFGKSDPLTMWADGSSFTFAGALSANAKLLTLHLRSYGRQVAGPWEVALEVPAK
jgi:hypothetical protein